jgi:diguanylate cyclase (GGDEF)-like protein/PAS domain S-box-containing protein
MSIRRRQVPMAVRARPADRQPGSRHLAIVRPPQDLFDRIRWMLLIFSLAYVAILVAFALARVGRWTDVAAAVGLAGMGVAWIIQYRGWRGSITTDLIEAGIIVAVGIVTRPIDILMLVYLRLCARSLEEEGRGLLWVFAIYIAAFGSALAIRVGVSSVGTPLDELGFLAAGFPMTVVIMHGLGASLRKEKVLTGALRDVEVDSRLRTIVEHGADIIVLVDSGNRVAYASPSLERLRGEATPFEHIDDFVTPDDLETLRAAMDSCRAAPGTVHRVRFGVRTGDGRWRYMEAIASDGHAAAGAGSIVLTARDITEQRETEQALQLSEANFRILFTANPQPMWVFDRETLRFLEVNTAATDHYGYTREEFLSMRVTDIRPASDVSALEQDLGQGAQGLPSSHQWRHVVKDGRTIVVDIATHDLEFGGRGAVLVLAQDVTERLELDNRLRHQAFHDTLTGLANRALFYDRVEHAVARGQRSDDAFAVLFIDLDNFKAINDTVGHSAGDAVLLEVAMRLRRAIRPSDTAARLGGDEFAVLIEPIAGGSIAIAVAERIAASLNQPVEVEGDMWFVSGSVGIAFSDHSKNESVDTILRNADVAMYNAKKRGRAQFTVFEPEMYESVAEKSLLEAELRQAIERGELTLHYQPQIDLRRQRITGVEALVRWNHPRRGLLAPGEFIPVAEETGLIESVDDWVLEHAAAQMRDWTAAGFDPITMGVNVSGREIATPGLAQRIRQTVARVGLAPAQVELEVTESVAFEAENARETLERLREAGFRVAIDDFGVGFSMLSRLQELPVDRLKIDKSFVDKITFGEDEAPIVSGIIAMAHSLRLKVVAEGIETTEQLAFLKRAGCDEGQGYRLGRPMPAAEMEAQLARLAGTASRGGT